MAEEKNLMDKIESLCKRRGFVFPNSEIYGGMANTWDYGPYGAEMRKNIKDRWWKKFVEDREDMVGLDAALIMNPKVWEASGHLANFKDPLVECKKCHQRFQKDLVAEAKSKTGFSYDWDNVTEEEKNLVRCPKGGNHEFTGAQQFNLMFKTFFGPAEESANVAYFLSLIHI